MKEMDIRGQFAFAALPAAMATEQNLERAADDAVKAADLIIEKLGLQPAYVASAVLAAKIGLVEDLIRALKITKAKYTVMGNGQKWSNCAKAVESVINTLNNQLTQLQETP